MKKRKYFIGKEVNDFMIIDINYDIVGRPKYIIKCSICGDERGVCNLTLSATTHKLSNCKEMYSKSKIGLVFGDFTCTDSYFDRRLTFKLTCNICGVVRIVNEKDIKRHSNKHGYICHRSLEHNLEDYDTLTIDRLYSKYKNMVNRVNNPKYHSYDKYKKFDIEWGSFSEFAIDIYPEFRAKCLKFGIDGLVLDRVNNELGYIKGNVSFVTYKESSENRAIQVYFTYNNKLYKSATDFAKEINCSHSYVSKKLSKIKDGETIEILGHIIRRVGYESVTTRF